MSCSAPFSERLYERPDEHAARIVLNRPNKRGVDMADHGTQGRPRMLPHPRVTVLLPRNWAVENARTKICSLGYFGWYRTCLKSVLPRL